MLHGDGFLGTNANLLADIGLVLTVGNWIIFTVGAILAKQKKYAVHGMVQTGGVLMNIAMVLWLMVGPYLGEVLLEWGAEGYPGGFYWVPTVHGLIGLAALTVGIWVTLRGLNVDFLPESLQFDNYKPYMRWAYGLYTLATATGVGVYIMWFILSPLPPIYE